MDSGAKEKKKVHGGRHCAVYQCNNGQYQLNLWRQKPCEIHEGKKKDECECLRPFNLYGFPLSKVPKRATPQQIKVLEERRRQWVAAVHRKDWTPSANSVVCSKHFIDGHPTEMNPIPKLELGYDCQVKSGRKAPLPRTFTPVPKKSRKGKKCLQNDFDDDGILQQNDQVLESELHSSLEPDQDHDSDDTFHNLDDTRSSEMDTEPCNSCQCCQKWKNATTKSTISTACQWEDITTLDHPYSTMNADQESKSIGVPTSFLSRCDVRGHK